MSMDATTTEGRTHIELPVQLSGPTCPKRCSIKTPNALFMSFFLKSAIRGGAGRHKDGVMINNYSRWLLSILVFAVAPAFPLPALPAPEQSQQSPLLDQAPPQSPAHAGQGPQEQPDQSGDQSQQNPQNQLPTRTGIVKQDGTSNDRLFWTLPNFLTVENSKQVPPLTSRGKFKVVLRTSFDWVEYPYIGFLAAISQAEDSEPGYGQGAAGYWKRYGASFADNTDENFWTGAILPTLLHQDPRYYQLGKGEFLHRVVYAVSRQFIIRSDLGHSEFNISEIAGSAISAGISNAYHPAQDRTLTNTVSVWWTQVGWDTVGSVVKEFWPDIRRKANRHKGIASQP
jgi:hypothetical protein